MTKRGLRPAASLLAALALALFIVGCGGSQGTTGNAGAPADPTATTSGVIRFWEDRVKRDRLDFVAYNKLAAAYIQRARETGDVSDYSRAQAALEASLNSLPENNYTAVVLLAAVHVVKHEFEDAMALAEEAISLKPGDLYGYAVLGDAQLALGRYDEAYETYLKVVAESPGLSSFSRLAHLLQLRGDLDSAELAWQNAISTDGRRRPENTAWARVQMGHFYFNTGDLDSAEARYESALEAFPDYVHALAGLAKVRAARSDYDEAISLYSQVVARYPIPEYVIALGDVYHAAGRETEAVKQYDLVSAIDRLYKANGVNTDLQMALFFADHDLSLGEALRQARAEYERRGSIQAADVLAWALYKSGRYQEAQTYSREALRLGSQDALMLFHAGMIEERLGDYEGARDYLERAVAINPRFSVLYSETAADTLRELQSVVRR